MSFDLTITAGVLVSVLGLLITWVRLRNEALNKRLEGQSARLDRHEVRIASAEQTLTGMPGRDEMHRLELSLTEIRGDLKQIGASMDGNSKVMARLETVVTRQEEHLLRGSGR